LNSFFRVNPVEKTTVMISDQVQRIDLRDIAYGLAARGEYGPAVQKAVATLLPDTYPLSAAQNDMVNHITTVETTPASDVVAPISRDPKLLTNHVKSLASFLKVDQVGIGRVPAWAYYSHDKQGQAIEPRFQTAIVMVMGKHGKTLRASTGSDWIGDPISFQAYQHLALVSETMANYIRRLGWEASPQYGPSFVDRYDVLMPPLLLAAGLGELCRIGIILNPALGPSFKAAAVLTTMPLQYDSPIDFGLQRFCQHCGICAENCPSQAISFGDKVVYNGYETWKIDTRRCASFNFTNKNGTMCNRCVKSCPWSYPQTWPHNLVRGLVTRSQLARRIAIKGAEVLDTGQGHTDEKWWFDVTYVNGKLEVSD
jgi:reductive dehalogenase